MKFLIDEFVAVLEKWFVVNNAYVYQVTFSHKCTVKYTTREPSKSVRLLPLGSYHKEALNLMNDGRYCGKEWRENFLIAIPGVNGLSRLTHDEKVLPDFVELGKFVIDGDITLQSGINF